MRSDEYPDGRSVVPNFLHADLANRLADEASITASRIQNMCLRALDYCPPVGITFGDYLRALVTADRDSQLEDEFGYRAALINAFRSRGIRPEGVFSYGEDALNWKSYEPTQLDRDSTPDFARLWQDVNVLEEQPEGRHDDLSRRLYQRLWGKADTFALQLGLAPHEDVWAKSLNTIHRVRHDGSLQRQIVAELVQTREVPIVKDDPASPTLKFRGGTTLIINRQGVVRYSIAKALDGPEGDERLARQREYLAQMAGSFALAPYVAFDHQRDIGFCSIHRGY